MRIVYFFRRLYSQTVFIIQRGASLLFGGELGGAGPIMGQIGWGGPSTGLTLLFGAVEVSPCRCEPLRAGCCCGEGGCLSGIICMYVICKDSAAPAHARTRAHRPAAPHQSSGVSQTPHSTACPQAGIPHFRIYIAANSSLCIGLYKILFHFVRGFIAQ